MAECMKREWGCTYRTGDLMFGEPLVVMRFRRCIIFDPIRLNEQAKARRCFPQMVFCA